MSLPFLTGTISQQASAGGGGGAVTQEANLDHWWKFPSPGESSPPGGTNDILDVGTSSATRINIDAGNIAIGSGARTLGSNTFDVYTFNGSTAYAQKDFNYGSTLAPVDTFSFCAWVKWDTYTAYESIFCAGGSDGGWVDGFWLYATDININNAYKGTGTATEKRVPANSLVFGSNGFSNAVTPPGASVAYAPMPSTGTWAHIAAVLDVSGNTQKLYVNGVSGTDAGVTVQPPFSSFATGRHMRIGGARWGTTATAGGVGFYFDGQLSDVRIYSVALTASEVASIYAGDWSP